jgi:hypothetical protein
MTFEQSRRRAVSNQAEFSVSEAPALWPGARVYRLACRHGVSSAALIPGLKPLADVAVFDIALLGHHRHHRCKCLPALPLRPLFEARA